MDVVSKITEACYYYTLCNKNYKETLDYLKISRITLQKYILIGNHLDYSLQAELNKKGKHKLSLTFANILANIIKDQCFQYYIYQNMCSDNLTNKQKIVSLNKYIECPICCEESTNQIILPCCSHFTCINCLFKHIDLSINGIKFEGCKCPLCNSYLSRRFIYDLLTINKKKYKWMRNIYTIYSKKNYYRNLFRKFRAIIETIKNKQKKKINNQTMDFDELIDYQRLYYGVCNNCCPQINNNPNGLFYNLKVNVVEKQCVNGEGNLVVLNKEMFKCESCTTVDSEYKKCPHCGIKTLKPDGCNYVICGDHRWCFICNERLPNNHQGHNVHFWTGPGTNPYSNQCRKSISYPDEDFILNWCDCISCRRYDGKRLCSTLECYNRCNGPLCNECRSLD